MAPISESDDELLDIYHGKVPLPPGWVRGKYAARYAAVAKPHLLDLSEPVGEVPTGAGTLTPEQEKLKAFFAKVRAQWLPLARACTRPIWTWRDEQFQLAGTGTLFRLADSVFLVTASHVVERSEQDRLPLIVTAGIKPDRYLTFELTGEIRGDRNDDVAVWELSADVANAFPVGDPLSFYQADRRGVRTGHGLYAVHGYPSQYCGQVSGTPGVLAVVTDSYTTMTGLYPEDPELVSNYDSRRHLLVSTGRVGLYFDGNPWLVPSLEGMSGGSIWQVYSQGFRSDLWTPDFPAVAAVQTHFNRRLGYIRGTRWWVVDQLIREGWPHLVPALSLEVPDPRPTAV